MNTISRRSFGKLIAGGTLAGFTNIIGYTSAQPATPDAVIDLTAEPASVPIFDGVSTRVWSYRGEIRQGPESLLDPLSGSYLGPIFRVKPGMRLRINFHNRIPQESIIHWHGLHLPPDMDGHPKDAIPQNGTYEYDFTVRDRPGTYWFHPHPNRITGEQVYYGLAGMFIVENDDSGGPELPSGEYDQPLVIQDRSFGQDGSLQYIGRGMMSHRAMMSGFLGDTILVNGKPDFRLPVKRGTYRFRLLNGSNARIYKLYLDNGSPFTVIGTDGGLIAESVQRDFLVTAPGERYEIFMDFSDYPAGTSVSLRSMEYSGGAMGMGSGMMGGRGMRGRRGMMGGMMNNMAGGAEDFRIMDFEITGEEGQQKELPGELTTIPVVQPREAVNFGNPRRFNFEVGMMRLTINGRSFHMTDVAPYERFEVGNSYLWDVVNVSPMPHPVHVHGLQFRILKREGVARDFAGGYVDEGYKDTFLLMPGESVRALLEFKDFTGLYIYHCHNLEHEDMGMMRNYLIE